ncbi:MAG: Radical SAM domain protein [uncultured Corynebacteriales bacterium]|uniref:Radical SAM domain protein n=1 Tax=uncultured Mycobacteriales bacterium TaxID=581187 RepID=A0A6J4J9L8_9ACTN|nr:MAG: Radical SAM domain protein [uncultured Corynebacteriales bacterium]
MSAAPLRWRLADAPEESGQGSLFSSDDLMTTERGTGRLSGLEFLHVHARKIVNEVPARSRMPFRFTINAYRGCSHACTYCFARPTHDYLGLDIGADFDRRIVVKVNAVQRLRAELRAPAWAGGSIAMGTNTDPYQRCEGKYRLTRGLVEVLAEARNPFSVLTKSALVLRDLDVLAAAARRTDVSVSLSIGTLDEAVWRATEPGAPHPLRRVDAVRQLAAAGIRTGVLVAPVLPGLSDSPDRLEEVVTACVAAGARSVTAIALHLRPGVREHFLGWLRPRDPALAADYERRYRRAYLPEQEQRRLAARVRAIAERSGARYASPAEARIPT